MTCFERSFKAEARASASISIKAGSHFWMSWTEISVANAASAAGCRRIELAKPTSDDAFGQAIGDELRASMTAVVAASFAIDAWHADVKELIRQDQPDWSSSGPLGGLGKRPSRSEQISTTLTTGFVLGPDANRLRKEIKALFTGRDRAVHHRTVMNGTEPHPCGKTNVSADTAFFTAERATAASRLAVEVIALCIGSPRGGLPALVKWCADRPHVGDHVRRVLSEADLAI